MSWRKLNRMNIVLNSFFILILEKLLSLNPSFDVSEKSCQFFKSHNQKVWMV